MEKDEMLDHLLDLAAKLGVHVRTGRYEGKGGMGWLRGEWVLLIDRSMPTESRVDLLIDELSRLDYEEHYLPPVIRELLDRAAAQRNRPRNTCHSEPTSPAEGNGSAGCGANRD